MKFGKSLLAAQVPEWSWNYISYKLLKQQITLVEEARRQGNSADLSDKITTFFFTLDRELEKVNSFYIYKKTVLERRMRILLEKQAAVTGNSGYSAEDGNAENGILSSLNGIRESIHKILRFAELNSNGFRKILKKFEKRTSIPVLDDHLTKIKVMPFFDSHEFDDMLEDIDAIFDSLRSERMQNMGSKQNFVLPKRLDDVLLRDDANELKSIFRGMGLKGTDIVSAPLNPDNPQGIVLTDGQYDKAMILTHTFYSSCKHSAVQCILLTLENEVEISGADDSNDRNFIHKLVLAGGNPSRITEISTSGISHKTSIELPSLIQVQTKEDDPTLLEDVFTKFPYTLPCLLAADIYGRLPLHYAAINGNVKITRALLTALKRVSGGSAKHHLCDWIDHEGHSPFMYALLRGYTEIVKEIFGIEHRNVDDLTATPIDPPSTTVISASMSNLAPISIGGSFSWKSQVQKHTPLAVACKFGYYELTKYLVSKGANINFVDENGETPLHLAVKSGHLACADILLNPSAHIENLISNSAVATLECKEKICLWTPLFFCCVEGHVECAKLLLKYGCSANVLDASGWTPHEHAIFRGYLDIAQLLKPLTSIKDLLNYHAISAGTHDQRRTGPLAANEEYSIRPGVFYGHNYLKNRNMFIITLGSNDIRLKRDIVHFFDGVAPAYPSLSLTISSKNALGEPAIVDLPIKDRFEPIIFYSQEDCTRSGLDNLIINFDIHPTFGSKRTTVAKGSVLLSSIWRGYGYPQTSGQHVLPLISQSLDVIGKLHFEFSVVTPYYHPKLSVGSKSTYWKYVETKIIGHRGAGANKVVSGPENLQIGENTVLSLVTAASLGAEYVEFDVQITKDKIPVIYHDWILSETGLNIAVNSVTTEEFKSLGPQSSGIKGAYKRLGNKSDDDFSVKYGSDISIEKSSSPNYDLLKTYFNKKHHGGRGDHAIKAPFATLEELFKKVPPNTGFNIEVKYPDAKEISENQLSPYELNEFVDAVLKCVYDHAGDRKILFSSFHPETCLMLNMKQPNYPVFFLTEAGTAKNYDNRCNSLKESIRFAKFADLLGIVSVSDPLIEAPHLCRAVKENGLLLFSYGSLNNDVKNFELQKRFGVDAVIVDKIKPIVSSEKPPKRLDG